MVKRATKFLSPKLPLVWTVQHLWNLNMFDTNYQMNQSAEVILNFIITTFISTFHFKHWQKPAQ